MPVSVSKRSSRSDLPSAGEPGSTTVSALVSSVSSSAICTTGCSGSPCSTYQVMSRAASQIDSDAARQPEQAAELVGVAGLGRRAEHPATPARRGAGRIAPRARRPRPRATRLLNKQRGVGEADRRLGAGLSSPPGCRPRGRAPRARARRLRDVRQRRARPRARGRGSRPPRARGSAARRRRSTTSFGPGSNSQSQIRCGSRSPTCRSRWGATARAASGRAAGASSRTLHARGHLVGVTQVRPQRVGDARDAPRPRGRCRRRRRRSARSRRRSTAPRPCPRRPRGSARRASPSMRRRRRWSPSRSVEPARPRAASFSSLKKTAAYARSTIELRGVLQLDEEVFDGMWRLVIHAAALPMMS